MTLPPDSSPARLRSLGDEKLLEQCRWEAFRGSGPGGQKRNKTSSAVRMVHVPTGLSATAGDSRSQDLNRRRALERLRWRMTVELREPLGDLAELQLPEWWREATAGGRIGVGLRDGRYLPAVGLVLDVLWACDGAVAEAARALGVGTGQLVRFIEDDGRLWAEVNALRGARGLKPLR